MIYFLAGVFLYVVGWFAGYYSCYASIVRLMDQLKAHQQEQEIKKLYPDQ